MWLDVLVYVLIPVAVVGAPIGWFCVEWREIRDEDLNPTEPRAYR